MGTANEAGTLILYESPHRILDTLADISELFPQRPVVVGRELTKVYEEFLRGTASQIREQIAARPAIKGEFTLLLARNPESPTEITDPAAEVARLEEEEGLGRMDAIKAVAKQLSLPKREVYRLLSEAGNNPPDKRRD
jgi:16S rRNA (cytidine1402-2'-O)-methyltransferase